MLVDVVVDTNILLHASRGHVEAYRSTAFEFLSRLLASETRLCVDEGFDFYEPGTGSLIAREYQDNVRQVHDSYYILTSILAGGRLNEVGTRMTAPQRKVVNRLRSRSGDRIKAPDRRFLVVALNSVERVLVSHDEEDFTDENRALVKAHLGVEILYAMECVGRL